MALNIADLTAAAGFETSKNSYLQRILVLCRQYNSSAARQKLYGAGAGTNKLRNEELDTIVQIVSDYLTSKQPSAKVKNGARWAALTRLAENCATEAQSFGAKQLTSPADFREIKGDPKFGKQSYWLELIDQEHRPGFWLSAKYEEWLTKPRRLVSAPVGQAKVYRDFWSFVGADVSAGQVIMLDANGRMQYEMTLGADGVLKDYLDQPVTTKDMETAASGPGWGIFVLSQDGTLYVNSHRVGIFHHSSFLSGSAAAAAGEVCVDESGRICAITNKTGHYRAGMEEMKRLVTMLPVEPLTIILPDYTRAAEPPREALFYDVSQFRALGNGAPALKKSVVESRLPAWARSGLNPRIGHFLKRIPDQT